MDLEKNIRDKLRWKKDVHDITENIFVGDSDGGNEQPINVRLDERNNSIRTREGTHRTYNVRHFSGIIKQRGQLSTA